MLISTSRSVTGDGPSDAAPSGVPALFDFGIQPLELVARLAIVYVVFILVLRVFGKRELGQFTIFDLALLVLAANALQPAMTGPDTSVAGPTHGLGQWSILRPQRRLPKRSSRSLGPSDLAPEADPGLSR